MIGIGDRNWKRELASLKESAPSLTALTLAVFVPVLFIARTLDRELMMIAFSVMFFLGATLAAVTAWFINSKRNSQSLSLWDVAGGFVITGCAASVMAEPEHAAQLFEHLFERRSESR
ncbi:hypothetical protein OCAR_6623 [Afipia carboxidovorans OM5]|nr:hypothetical protein OCAR_6623 [Afipia carboxidovorans OM5]BEV46951.1 hypothetical protein CRBSH125_31340 [Afipia carboxidovorans]